MMELIGLMGTVLGLYPSSQVGLLFQIFSVPLLPLFHEGPSTLYFSPIWVGFLDAGSARSIPGWDNVYSVSNKMSLWSLFWG